MPSTPEEMRRTSLTFYKITKFPGVIGAIDCTHVRIQSPGTDQAENYRNRKGWFSINVQTVVDAEARITNIVARWPGSTHDATIFNNSRLYRRLETGEFGNDLLVADGGYRNTEYMVTPHLNTQTAEEQLYNSSHISTRNVVERSYGILKRLWPVLSMDRRVRIHTVQSIIVACAVLHNIAMNERDYVPDDEIDGINDGMGSLHE
ncbi:PREDICTED: putative nuclease HARBI1 [Rhagoletis zephyria]|uniref:putative nuclease HARBI1 n=1 Tax=Rhagoletis zephyria TaxID=28612 RepID=UPI00081128A4|nr:PREDICTED: putative nuclease HARBI1 [Rhagoletis zephyria]XP_036340248.1 putative nuclease HARBI1 [Rhagoletis pomonella]